MTSFILGAITGAGLVLLVELIFGIVRSKTRKLKPDEDVIEKARFSRQTKELIEKTLKRGAALEKHYADLADRGFRVFQPRPDGDDEDPGPPPTGTGNVKPPPPTKTTKIVLSTDPIRARRQLQCKHWLTGSKHVRKEKLFWVRDGGKRQWE